MKLDLSRVFKGPLSRSEAIGLTLLSGLSLILAAYGVMQYFGLLPFPLRLGIILGIPASIAAAFVWVNRKKPKRLIIVALALLLLAMILCKET